MPKKSYDKWTDTESRYLTACIHAHQRRHPRSTLIDWRTIATAMSRQHKSFRSPKAYESRWYRIHPDLKETPKKEEPKVSKDKSLRLEVKKVSGPVVSFVIAEQPEHTRNRDGLFTASNNVWLESQLYPEKGGKRYGTVGLGLWLRGIIKKDDAKIMTATKEEYERLLVAVDEFNAHHGLPAVKIDNDWYTWMNPEKKPEGNKEFHFAEKTIGDTIDQTIKIMQQKQVSLQAIVDKGKEAEEELGLLMEAERLFTEKYKDLG